jgi:diguanylate cyclase (GGDEF)-like protein
MLFNSEEKIYKSFVISICLIVALSLLGIFLDVTTRTRSLILEELISHSRAYFETIVATRLWNANYGGVYVEKKAGVLSNPYYPNPDIKIVDGRTFTIRNPAMMTREISGYIGKEKDFSFHITSKKLLNPDNKPDGFELSAFDLFEKGQKEVYEIDTIGNKKYFRYMGPLFIKKDCLKCHAHQGYKAGDVRGGISVMYNVDHVYSKLNTNTLLIALFAVTTTVLLMLALWILTRRLMRKIADARQQIEEMAIKDMLTGIFNRRYLMQRLEEEFDRAARQKKSLGCMLLDIDHFKSINDRLGHLVGDEVLKEVAQRINNSVRAYDVTTRYGGEEFMVILPDTSIESVLSLAERISHNIKNNPIRDLTVTISIGATVSRDTDKTIDEIIKRADDGMYEAKAAGRDCVKGCGLPEKT